ncbi:hypothetical protein M409DRAFT_54686 [Zasmidium cellare ATCC 36951]|uniref:Ubiquitin 3 binding protein But2 C-terminal domain-containing protein n=1 Tax=Zasmidium cellare ATCC 36951 TaxID=1080233 RepID=A0A6A6CLU9_ZASCE|nr:uncharacterized protein M409DRAFT_54686 [Zasmidium cellare ATCC 36951]KAF2166922.1 hypothetical protein M409DRAFT_54686 [Zasmidium cellare ATCC 36951]
MKPAAFACCLFLFLNDLTLAVILRTNPRQDLFQPSPLFTMTSSRHRLIGDNDARYCGVPEEKQLFKIGELSISPRPPTVDTRLFALLKGGVKDISESDLEEAVINLTTKSSNGGSWVLDMKFSEFPQIIVRHERQYSKYLKPGVNEIIGDLILPGIFTTTATYSFNVEAKLPDGRTLFCFEFEYYLEGDL